MKKQTSLFLRRTAALVLAVLLVLPTAYAAAGEQKLQTVIPVTDGLNYVNTVTENQSARVESYALELEEDNAVQPIFLQASGTVYGAATVNKAVSYAQSLGYHVLAAVNTDFFSTASGVPLGIVIEDGVYKSNAGGRPALVIADGEISVCETPAVSLTLENLSSDFTVAPSHFNKWRSSTGGVYLLNRDFSTVSTRTSTSGWYVRMEQITGPDSLDVNTTTMLTVTEVLRSDQPLTIGENEYILTADDVSRREDVFAAFSPGDRVVLTTSSCEDEVLSSAQWASGAGDVMIRDGALTDTSDWSYIKDGRAPRTALGMKKDGTVLIYTVDGRSSGHSMGLSQKDLAEELLAQGCEWAVNLDGGGSTAISVWLPGQAAPAVQNRPSDGRARGCATYLLLVTDKTGSGKADRLALTEDGITVLAGSSVTLPSAAVLDEGLNLLDKELSDLKITSEEGLGTVTDGVYTAGEKIGTDTLRLYSRSLRAEGYVQIHVVDSLSSLTVTKADDTAPLTALSAEPGEQIQLAVSGNYWNRPALRDTAPVEWTVSGDVGTVDENGLLTVSENGGSGEITASAGGQSYTFSLSTRNVHRDVTEEHWAYAAVSYCYDKGIVGGVSATQFGRDHTIRRADFMLMLYNAVGRPAPAAGCSFTDVNEADYYYTALSWAQEAGLASGTGDGAYSPSANITREQAFTILRKAMPLLGKECPDAGLIVLDAFGDKDLIADYARGFAATLVAQGVVSGKGDNLDPRGSLTRAEMAALLYKIITYTPVPDVPQDPIPEEPAPPAPDLPEEPAPEVPAPLTGTVTNAELSLNVRSGPGTSHTVIGRLENGAQVTVLERLEGWYRILFPAQDDPAAEGYVSADYLTLSN